MRPATQKMNTPFALANRYLRDKNYDKAILLYQEALREGPVHDVYSHNLTWALQKAGMEAEADRSLYQALTQTPKSEILSTLLRHRNKTHIEQWTGPKLSIIVPVFNSAQYLEQCLTSIVNQTFRDFELLVVNDGSTDNSGEIIQRFAKQDSRIAILVNEKPSGNPGTPRNQAIMASKGAFIGFVDSDDWIDPGFFSALMDKATKDYADLVFSGGFKNHLATGVIEQRKYNNTGFDDPTSDRYKYHDSFMIWDKIYSIRMIKSCAILLGETRAAVDVPFIFKAYYYAQRISCDASLIEYNYRRESQSSVTVRHRKNSNCSFEFEAFDSVHRWAQESSVSERFKRLIETKMASSLLYTLRVISKEHFPTVFPRVKKQLDLVDEESFKKFCITQKKWWLYKELREVKTKEEDEVARFFQEKKDSEERNRLHRLLEPKLYIPGRRNGIMFFPAWLSNNPYQKLFYEAVAKRFGLRVAGFAREALCKRLLEQQRAQFDYIHLHWLHAFIDPARVDGADHLVELLAYARTLGYTIIYTAHNIISHDSRFYEAELMQRRVIMKHVDIAVAHGKVAKKMLTTELGVSQEKIAIVPHGTYDGYYKNSVGRLEARKALNIDPDAFVFLFFGNIRKYKGLEPLLEQYEKIAKCYPKTKLLIAGRILNSDLPKALEDEARASDIIFKPGFVEEDEAQYYFNAANVCVLPYKRIVTSGAAMLSITFSCPLIAPRDGVLPEIIGDDIGMLFDDYEHMRECMIQMLESANRSVYPNSGDSVFSHYRDRFSWRKVVSALPF